MEGLFAISKEWRVRLRIILLASKQEAKDKVIAGMNMNDLPFSDSPYSLSILESQMDSIADRCRPYSDGDDDDENSMIYNNMFHLFQ